MLHALDHVGKGIDKNHSHGHSFTSSSAIYIHSVLHPCTLKWTVSCSPHISLRPTPHSSSCMSSAEIKQAGKRTKNKHRSVPMKMPSKLVRARNRRVTDIPRWWKQETLIGWIAAVFLMENDNKDSRKSFGRRGLDWNPDYPLQKSDRKGPGHWGHQEPWEMMSY